MGRQFTGGEMTFIQKRLFELQDKEYALFQSKLTPTVDPKLFVGVRVPACRALAKDLYKSNTKEVERFFSELPHKYYDENMNMMIAWFFATALTKQWDSTIGYIEEGKLDEWVHNKTIQKARESYRISDEQKQYLNKLKK